MTGALTRYDAACRAVAEAKSVDEVKDLRDKADAMRVYARQAKNKQLEVDAAEIRMRAERRLGEMERTEAHAGRLNRGGRPSAKTGSKTNPVSRAPTLAELGIGKQLADRARKLAAVPEEKFEGMLGEWRERVQRETERVTTNLMKEGERVDKREAYDAQLVAGCTVDDLSALAGTGQRFPVIYADPPWEFRVYSGKGKQRSAERYYDTQGIDAIKTLPVQGLAADDCALFLWCVMPELPGALEVIASWGFTYKTAGFTWVKQNRGGQGLFTGMGYWTRANAELCLLATRGSPHRLAMDVPQVVMAPVAEHSRKPDEVRGRIERLLAGPYLELYGRESVQGWTVWGNQIERKDFTEDEMAEVA